MDFAGGTVVHINAGVAGLVCALVLGKRRSWARSRTTSPNDHRREHAVGRVVRLQRGHGGRGPAFLAAVAMVDTQVATAVAAIAWMAVIESRGQTERARPQRPARWRASCSITRPQAGSSPRRAPGVIIGSRPPASAFPIPATVFSRVPSDTTTPRSLSASTASAGPSGPC